jgi:uncharacterized protein YxjI
MGLRDMLDQRRGEHEVFGSHGTATRFQMRRRLLTRTEPYWVQDETATRIFRIENAVVEDAHGTPLCQIAANGLVLPDSLDIEDADGESLAVVHRTFLSPAREQWHVMLADLTRWEIHGTVGHHDYEVRVGGRTIAHVSKKGAQAKHGYVVEVAPGEDAALLLAVAVAADAIEHAEG